MDTTQHASSQLRPKWNRNVYTCTDRLKVACRQLTFEIGDTDKLTLPRNGIRLIPDMFPAAVISETWTSRDMMELIDGSLCRTYTFPLTMMLVGPQAFYLQQELCSVKLNEGLERLEGECFRGSGIRQVVLPASVNYLGVQIFCQCAHLQCVDLRAACGLKMLGESAFAQCTELRRALLN